MGGLGICGWMVRFVLGICGMQVRTLLLQPLGLALEPPGVVALEGDALL